MRRVLKIVAILLVVLVLGIQAIRPARTNPPIDESQTINAKTQMTSDVAAIFDRSCRDCHTNKTVWPWYTNVAPLSWWLSNHVSDGRRSLNMSEWSKLPNDRQERKLRQICDEVQDGNMPLSSYTPMHPAAKLSDQDKKTLCDWTETERQRLSNSAK
ncbi:MAG TPA: heme-binding domain-containing protein [Pyrinomonadaceae bacterium]|jgi:cytochrome c551/c552|nr:heme-binding domain-containing protein [Pyrinomonadaceae bacterium]